MVPKKHLSSRVDFKPGDRIIARRTHDDYSQKNTLTRFETKHTLCLISDKKKLNTTVPAHTITSQATRLTGWCGFRQASDSFFPGVLRPSTDHDRTRSRFRNASNPSTHGYGGQKVAPGGDFTSNWLLSRARFCHSEGSNCEGCRGKGRLTKRNIIGRMRSSFMNSICCLDSCLVRYSIWLTTRR